MGKLVLTRRVGDTVVIGDDIIVCVERIDSTKIRLSFQAPKEVSVVRGELKKGDTDAREEASAG